MTLHSIFQFQKPKLEIWCTYDAGEYVTHVGIFVSSAQMYHAGSSGIGYVNLTDNYWQQHLIGAGRIKQ